MTLTLTGAGAASASSAFSPLSVSGLQAWYKADAGTSTTTDGVAISQWSDQSGNASHAVQATGVSQPLYKAAIVNGLPVVRFDGTNDWLDAAGVNVSQPNTTFLVAKPAVTPNGWNALDGTTTRQAILGNSAAGNFAFYAGTSIVAAASAWVAGSFSYISAVFNGASSQLWAGGVSAVTGNPGAAAINGLRIGTFQSGSGEWNGDIAEVLIYNTALSTTDRQSVENYLKTKYGL